MSLSEFCRIKWERAKDLKRRGKFEEAEKELSEALDFYEKLRALDPEDRFVRKEILRLKGLSRSDRRVVKELEAVVNIGPARRIPFPSGRCIKASSP